MIAYPSLQYVAFSQILLLISHFTTVDLWWYAGLTCFPFNYHTLSFFLLYRCLRIWKHANVGILLHLSLTVRLNLYTQLRGPIHPHS